jgi:hypothetical protein
MGINEMAISVSLEEATPNDTQQPVLVSLRHESDLWSTFFPIDVFPNASHAMSFVEDLQIVFRRRGHELAVYDSGIFDHSSPIHPFVCGRCHRPHGDDVHGQCGNRRSLEVARHTQKLEETLRALMSALPRCSFDNIHGTDGVHPATWKMSGEPYLFCEPCAQEEIRKYRSPVIVPMHYRGRVLAARLALNEREWAKEK